MRDEYRIDSHKLSFHPERVSRWLKGENIYPIGIEIAPSGTCNHRCTFCALDYMEYRPLLLDKELILKNLKELSDKGLKSAVFAGEGEPLVNKHTPEIIEKAKSFGIDTAISTNGVLLTKDIAGQFLGCLTWIRFSVSAATPATYHSIHRGHMNDFETTIANIREAVQLKRGKGLTTTIGVQMLLIPENVHEVVLLAKLLKEAGVDYFTVKPFSQHPKSLCTMDGDFDYNQHIQIEKELKDIATKDFRVIFRTHAMVKKSQERCYEKCFGLPFFTYIDANGGVWPCIAFLGEDALCFGNLKEESFIQIWEGTRRREVIDRLNSRDITQCRELCRLDEINRYLHELVHPGEHVNFI